MWVITSPSPLDNLLKTDYNPSALNAMAQAFSRLTSSALPSSWIKEVIYREKRIGPPSFGMSSLETCTFTQQEEDR